MSTDGKYCTLAQAKQYIIGTRTDPNNPTVFNQQVSGTPDDGLVSDCIIEAEAAFEMECGTGFDQQTLTMVQPIVNWVDQNGWLWLFARERGPVTAVSAVSCMDMQASSNTWQTLTWDTTGTPPNGIILPPGTSIDGTHPWPESWRVRIRPTNPSLTGHAPGELLVAWTYTGGFATIPQSLLTLIMRMTAYVYRLREMPVGKVVNMPLGTITVPADFPPDLRRQMKRWSPVYG